MHVTHTRLRVNKGEHIPLASHADVLMGSSRVPPSLTPLVGQERVTSP